MKEAYFYDKLSDKKVRCRLCPHECRIPENKTGFCCVRNNIDGMLYSMNYDKIIAEHIDPVEKKPLFHVLPGSRSYSIASAGCNFTCRHCQNAEISQFPRDRGICIGEPRMPAEIVASAQKAGCASISYTYTEPTVYYELAGDTAKLAAEKGLKNIFVSNGYISSEPLTEISPYLHAANIDLKAFSDDFYRTICGARLEPVLEAIRLYKKLGIWIEITTLIIPRLNDSPEMLAATAEFIAGVGKEIPWHVSAFHPTHLMTDRGPTPVETLLLARDIGLQAGLRYVYTGNIPGAGGEDTLCHRCGSLLITRKGYAIAPVGFNHGKCSACGAGCAGIFA